MNKDKFLLLGIISLMIIFIIYIIIRLTYRDNNITVPQDYVYPSSEKWQYTPENEIFIGKDK